MTMEETAKLLFIVKANYPKYYRGTTEQEFEDMVYAWHICISDYDYNLAQAGVKVFLSADTKGFPPAVGQVLDSIYKILREEGDCLTELDAWGMVYKAICNSGYHADEEYAKLPTIVQRAVGNPARLKEWALLDMKDVMTVSQSNFMRSFRAVQEQQKIYRKMPDDIKQMLPDDKWSGRLRIVDMEEEIEAVTVNQSSPEFISNKMDQFYDVIGIKKTENFTSPSVQESIP